MSQAQDSPDLPTTCVVGAGPAGLAAARAFKAAGLPVQVFERHGGVGGLWDPDNEGSPIYETAHFISSKTLSGYPDFPMPDSFPDYPSHRQILSYLRDFVAAYQLDDVITTGCGVEEATWDGMRWLVQLQDGSERSFDHLLCANGTQWHPNLPEIPGQFNGTLMHSSEYWNGEAFRGKRVLVVGAGNSGVDIACDAAVAADTAHLSMRRGYHVIPKHILGKPADVFAGIGPELPMRISQAVFGRLLRLLHGKPSNYGLPEPDHKLFETHPILNTEIFHFLSHGDLAIRPDVSRFDGTTVHFADGTSDDYDTVVLATGYKTPIPYVEASLFEWRHDRPVLYLHAFHRSNPNLHALGFTEGDGAGYTVFDNTAVAIAGLVKMMHQDPRAAERWTAHVAQHKPDLSGGINRIDTPRHANYLHVQDYLKLISELCDEFGWDKPDPSRYQRMRSVASSL